MAGFSNKKVMVEVLFTTRGVMVVVSVSSTKNDGSCVGSNKMGDDSGGFSNVGSRCSGVFGSKRSDGCGFFSNNRNDASGVFFNTTSDGCFFPSKRSDGCGVSRSKGLTVLAFST